VTRSADRAGLFLGLVALVVVSVVYPVFESATWQPLAVFAIPPLLAAVYSSWRAVIPLGLLSILVGGAFAVTSGIEARALVARLVIIVVVVGCGAVAAEGRDRRQRALDQANRSTAALSAFEAGLIGTRTEVPGFGIVTRYRPAESLLRLSGDFVDTAPDRSGALAFVVGDVSGHGASQAALGASLRSGWRAAAVACPGDPLAWLLALRDAFFPCEDLDHYATVCTGLVHPDGRAVLVSAGHPWPVLLGPAPRLVDVQVGPPLGVGTGVTWRLTEVRLTAPLLVYTDGLVEAPDAAGARWGEDGLLTWLGTHRASDLESYVDELIDAALDGRRATDDVATLVLCLGTCGAGIARRPA
jgi:serine phosphatase RsbU (regulator of sigma subunit)